jgi:hypothetical protein
MAESPQDTSNVAQTKDGVMSILHSLSKEIADQYLRYEDGNLFWKVSNSNRVKIGDKIVSKSSYGYFRLSINGTRYFAHRVIYLMHHGYMPDIVDHIDMDITNNRIENLRAATKSQNMCNAGVRSNSSTKIKGVSWSNKNKKWVARLTLNKRLVFQKLYDDISLAAIGINEARLVHHGEFSRHA